MMPNAATPIVQCRPIAVSAAAAPVLFVATPVADARLVQHSFAAQVVSPNLPPRAVQPSLTYVISSPMVPQRLPAAHYLRTPKALRQIAQGQVPNVVPRPRGDEKPAQRSSAEVYYALRNMLQQPFKSEFVDFIRWVSEQRVRPALFCGQNYFDRDKYFELRRHHLLMRKFLEHLEEELLDEHSAFPDVDKIARMVLERAAQHQKADPRRFFTEIDTKVLARCLDDLHLWPCDFTEEECGEVLTGLQYCNVGTVHALYNSQNLSLTLSLENIAESLRYVPFILPECPVPTCFLEKRPVKTIAKDIAAKFHDENTGYTHVKDPFLTNFLMLEQLQIALPYLAPIKLIEQAVELIARVAVRHFSEDEWNVYIRDLHEIEYRGEQQVDDEPETSHPGESSNHNADEGPGRLPPVLEQSSPEEAGDGREVRVPTPEVQVNTTTRNYPIDWESCCRPEGEETPYPRDESWTAPGEWMQDTQGSKPTCLISLDWHQECIGPVSAWAFIRCCQIYQERVSGN